jgi:predicted 3-demethylubiquinone-9 3-methyltransferase (glyoxalase superfamily)
VGSGVWVRQVRCMGMRHTRRATHSRQVVNLWWAMGWVYGRYGVGWQQVVKALCLTIGNTPLNRICEQKCGGGAMS